MFGLFKKKTETPPPIPGQSQPRPPEPPRASAPNHITEPLNEFERYLVAFHRREIRIQKFLEEFFNAQVYLLCDKEQFRFGDQGASVTEKPTLYSIITPDTKFLAMFSHIERAKAVKDPAFRFAVQVLAGEFFMGFETGSVGLALNPYWDINFHWSPQQLASIVGTIRR